MKRKLLDLKSQRNSILAAADAAFAANDMTTAADRMAELDNIDRDIATVEARIRVEEEREILTQPSQAEANDIVNERVNELKKGHSINFTPVELMRSLRNADGDGTKFGTTIAQPIGAGAYVNDNLGMCSLLDLVRVQDMTGLSGWQEPYIISDMATVVGDPATKAASTRTAKDPSFGVVEIKPYEVTTTSFCDRNIGFLSPAAYLAKIQESAVRALKNKAAALILCGDSETTRVMYGMLNGANKAGTSMVKTVSATVSSGNGVFDEGLLDELYFNYGDDYTVGGNAMLLCNKTDIKAIGKLRGTNEKRRLYGIQPMPGDANRGTIIENGATIPYIVSSALTAVNGTAQAASTGADKLCAIYGDPMNYLLGLFGGYTVRVDESVKSIERLYTVLGDMMIGGNVVAKDGFVVAKIPKAAV